MNIIHQSPTSVPRLGRGVCSGKGLSVSQIIAIVASGGGGGLDPNAQAFITAAGITDPTQQTAINQLVLDLKSASIWSSMTAIYPFVGGTSSTNSYNLVNPAALQITWHGTVTHNANGITGNGIDGYGDTGLNANTTTPNSIAFGIYNRTTESGGGCDIGAWTGGDGFELLPSFFLGTTYYDNQFNGTDGRCSFADTTGLRLLVSSRTASNSAIGYSNGVNQCNTTGAQGSLVNANFQLLCRSNVAGLFAANNVAFAFVSGGLSSGDVTNLTNAVNAFQTTLGRNV